MLIGSDDDDGGLAFKEYVGTIDNPGVGYTHTNWFNAAPNKTQAKDLSGNIVLLFVDIGAFSSGVNKDADYDLDETFFNALRATFENFRNNGSTFALRFRYDANGVDNPEPATFDFVLKHVKQIKDSGLLDEYKDILMFVESGFVGKWGEQHGGKYTTVEYKARLLEALLDCVPSPIPVTVRTPDIFAQYVGIKRSELADYVCEPDGDAARVGLYDDGYMGSNTDLGTYSNREAETTWLGNQTLHSYFGGEFSGNLDFAKQYETYLPENCIPEMYKTHLSYINSNIFQLYKDYKFDKKYDVAGYDNSAYYGKTVFDFIRDHLGYRFVLNKSKLPQSVVRGGELDLSFSLVNKGFANPVKKFKAELLLENDGKIISCEIDSDPTKWYSGVAIEEKLKIKLPGLLDLGKWNVYLKYSLGNTEMSQYAFRSVRFANVDVWNAALGANYIGSFEVTDTDDERLLTDNTFGEVGNTGAVRAFSFDGKINVDGVMSQGEWSNTDVIAEDGDVRLYAKCDEENLYILSNIAHKSTSPVFNLRIKNNNNNESYWLYVQSNGAIYFNHDAQTGHAGLLSAYSAAAFEFKIPFYMLGIENGVQLGEIRAFVQDSSISGWPGRGSITCATGYTVKCDFDVYNAYIKPSLLAESDYALTVDTEANVSDVVWLHDGNVIDGENSLTLKLQNVTQSDGGAYSATITTVNGSVKTVDIAFVTVLA
ncbi:MAG: DUF4832 domain-containing protein [Clostridiales bacterium]|nr:DUF4832 domain-containing protein [Clostridiales bacterium]